MGVAIVHGFGLYCGRVGDYAIWERVEVGGGGVGGGRWWIDGYGGGSSSSINSKIAEIKGKKSRESSSNSDIDIASDHGFVLI